MLPCCSNQMFYYETIKAVLRFFFADFHFFGCNNYPGKPRILVLIKPAGFHHKSIATAAPAILKLGVENNFTADTTSDATWFQEDSLQHYAAVVFSAWRRGALTERNGNSAGIKRWFCRIGCQCQHVTTIQ